MNLLDDIRSDLVNQTQAFETIQKSDTKPLLNLLHMLNLDLHDINELEYAISSRPTPTNDRLGPKVRN